MFALVLLLTAAGFSVWLNVTTYSQIITIALAEAMRRIFVDLLRLGGRPARLPLPVETAERFDGSDPYQILDGLGGSRVERGECVSLESDQCDVFGVECVEPAGLVVVYRHRSGGVGERPCNCLLTSLT